MTKAMKSLPMRSLGIAAIVLATSACGLVPTRQRCDVSLASVRMGQGEGLYQTVLLDLMVSNPDPSPLKLNALSYRVRIDGRELASGISREPLEVMPGATVKYTVPATVNVLDRKSTRLNS